MTPHILTAIFNMSIEASILICIICVFRLVFKKAPKWITCAVWGISGLKLIIPLSFESIVGLLPSKNAVSLTSDGANLTFSNNRVQQVVDNVITPAVRTMVPAAAENSSGSGPVLLSVLCLVWTVGFSAMIISALISFIRIYAQTRVSVRTNGYNLCDNIGTPFILGIIRPEIYIPSGLDSTKLQPIVAHETAHIKRRDHWWKPLGYLILSVYWFNPVIWLAYILLCQDIEFACDEKVLKNMTKEEKTDYSQILLDCSKQTRMITACPVAFGETGVKQRIKSVLSYKKPALWIIIVAIIASIIVSVCFTTKKNKPLNSTGSGIEYLFVTYDEVNQNKYTCWQITGNSVKKAADKSATGLNNIQIESWIKSDVAFNREVTSLPVTELYGPETDGSDLAGLYSDIFDELEKQFESINSAETFCTDKNLVFVKEHVNGKVVCHIYLYNNGLTELKSIDNAALCAAYDVIALNEDTSDEEKDGAIVYDAIYRTYHQNNEAYETMGCECSAAGYVILDTEETDTEKTIYALTEHGRFAFSNGYFMNVSGGSNPAVITVDKKTGEYTLKAPRDGELYGKDIRKMFPGKLADKVFNPTEKQRSLMWEQMKAQAQTYLDSIGRSAEICHYSEIEHVLFSDLGISTEIDNRITEMKLPYNQEIGNYERTEGGIRYVYQTDYDADNKLIKFTKFEYGTDNIAEYIEINAETGDVIQGAAYPSKVPGTPFQFPVKSGQELTTKSQVSDR